MDQGDAAVWAAGLGIVGTLFGALGGTLIQGHAARKQVADQEEADVRHRVRDERRTAYAAFLEQCDRTHRCLEDAMKAVTKPPSNPATSDEIRDTSRAAWNAIEALQHSAATVTITGPDQMAELVERTIEAFWSQYRAVAEYSVAANRSVDPYNSAVHERRTIQAIFIRVARTTLSSPDRPQPPGIRHRWFPRR